MVQSPGSRCWEAQTRVRPRLASPQLPLNLHTGRTGEGRLTPLTPRSADSPTLAPIGLKPASAPYLTASQHHGLVGQESLHCLLQESVTGILPQDVLETDPLRVPSATISQQPRTSLSLPGSNPTSVLLATWLQNNLSRHKPDPIAPLLMSFPPTESATFPQIPQANPVPGAGGQLSTRRGGHQGQTTPMQNHMTGSVPARYPFCVTAAEMHNQGLTERKRQADPTRETCYRTTGLYPQNSATRRRLNCSALQATRET